MKANSSPLVMSSMTDENHDPQQYHGEDTVLEIQNESSNTTDNNNNNNSNPNYHRGKRRDNNQNKGEFMKPENQKDLNLATILPSLQVLRKDGEESPLGVDIESADTLETKIKKVTTWRDVFVAWFACALAMVAGASVGPVFKYMAHQGIRPCLAASWRCQCMSLVLAPLALGEALYDKKNKVDWFVKKPDLQYSVLVHVIFSGLAWSANLLFWIVGLQYTTAFIASIIACSHPIIMVVFLQLTGVPLTRYEYCGVFLAFAGMIISCLQDLFENVEHSKDPVVNLHHQFLGYFLCLLAAIGEVFVIFNRLKTKKYVPLMQYTFGTTFVVAICASFVSVILEKEGIIYTPLVTDGTTAVNIFCLEDNCIFGWLSNKWFVTILVFGIWIGVFCISGFNYAMQFIAPLIFSALALLDPALTAIISWGFGVESLPSIFSWIGGIIVVAGVGIISLSESHLH